MKKISIFLFLFVSLLTNAQMFNISGKVVDENNENLPNASILIPKINKGIATNADGTFSLKLPKGSYVFQISFLGFSNIPHILSATLH